MMERTDILRKVRALLDQADSTTFPEEADAFRAKADELMFKYAIDSFEVDQAKPEERQVPTMRKFFVVNAENPVMEEVITLFHDVARHSRCKSVIYSRVSGPIEGAVVGYPADVEYVEMLFTSLWLQMSTGLEPRPNPEQTFEENVVMMLESGLSRVRVAEIMGLPRHPTISKMSKIYKAWCEEVGKPYIGKQTRPNPVTYARNFAQGYVLEVAARLRELRMRQGHSVKGTGRDLVLYDRSKVVDAAFHQYFPILGTRRQKTTGKFLSAAYSRGTEKGREADLGQVKVGRDKRPVLGGGE